MGIIKTQGESALRDGDKMVLLDGRLLPLYPREEKEETVSNTLQLDTTGEWMTIGSRPKKKPQQRPISPEERARYFLDNLFFFVANYAEILSDSRMFLAQVPVRNGLAYTGTYGFRRPTLGVYIEWWMQNGKTIVEDKSGKPSFYWYLSGSPLSGCNVSAVVNEHGETKTLPIRPFIDYWSPFTRINTRYDECKAIGEAYSLEQVKEILSRRDQSDYLVRAYRVASEWMSGGQE